MKRDFPEGAVVRADDVAGALIGVIEVNDVLRTYLNANKLRGKFWKTNFADLIIDFVWLKINGANE